MMVHPTALLIRKTITIILRDFKIAQIIKPLVIQADIKTLCAKLMNIVEDGIESKYRQVGDKPFLVVCWKSIVELMGLHFIRQLQGATRVMV